MTVFFFFSNEQVFGMWWVYSVFRTWWVIAGWLPGACQAALSLPILNRTGRENKMKGQGKVREITHRHEQSRLDLGRLF